MMVVGIVKIAIISDHPSTAKVNSAKVTMCRNVMNE